MENPPPKVEISPAKAKLFQIGAAWVGPLLCWLPLFLLLLTSLYHGEGAALPWIFRFVLGFFLLAYFPTSALICGFCSSYFLNRAQPQSEILHAGCWTQNLLLAPFLLHPAMWCLMPILVPLHVWLFGVAFGRGVQFWSSDRPRQWLGDFNSKD